MKYNKSKILRISFFIISLAIIATSIIVLIVFARNDKEWWENTGRVRLRFFDVVSLTKTVEVDFEKLDNNIIEFAYSDNGEENYPQIHIIYKNEELNFYKILSKQIYNQFDEKYVSVPYVKGSGEFIVSYGLYKNHTAIDLVKTVQIKIIIKEAHM